MILYQTSGEWYGRIMLIQLLCWLEYLKVERYLTCNALLLLYCSLVYCYLCCLFVCLLFTDFVYRTSVQSIGRRHLKRVILLVVLTINNYYCHNNYLLANLWKIYGTECSWRILWKLQDYIPVCLFSKLFDIVECSSDKYFTKCVSQPYKLLV